MTKTTERQETHVRVESAQDNSVDLLHQISGLSKQRIKATMTQGDTDGIDLQLTSLPVGIPLSGK